MKVQGSQLCAVALQAYTRLPLLGAFVSVHPRVGPVEDIGVVEYTVDMGSSSEPYWWVIFIAIVVNVFYPAVLLAQVGQGPPVHVTAHTAP